MPADAADRVPAAGSPRLGSDCSRAHRGLSPWGGSRDMSVCHTDGQRLSQVTHCWEQHQTGVSTPALSKLRSRKGLNRLFINDFSLWDLVSHGGPSSFSSVPNPSL